MEENTISPDDSQANTPKEVLRQISFVTEPALNNIHLIKKYEDFIERENIEYQRNGDTQKRIESDQFNDLAIMQHGGEVLSIAIKPNTYTSQYSFVTTCSEDNTPIGFDVVVINSNKEFVADQISVSFSKQQRGIGSQLINLRHQRLKELGIFQYTISGATDKTLGMFKKNGIRYQVHEDPETITVSIDT